MSGKNVKTVGPWPKSSAASIQKFSSFNFNGKIPLAHSSSTVQTTILTGESNNESSIDYGNVSLPTNLSKSTPGNSEIDSCLNTTHVPVSTGYMSTLFTTLRTNKSERTILPKLSQQVITTLSARQHTNIGISELPNIDSEEQNLSAHNKFNKFVATKTRVNEVSQNIHTTIPSNELSGIYSNIMTTDTSTINTIRTGAISSGIAEQVINAIGNDSNRCNLMANSPIQGRLTGLGIQSSDENKLKRIQKIVEFGISDAAKQEIIHLLDRISSLKPLEKLLLYLRLPSEQLEADPLRQPQNPLGTRTEINHTINWVRTHLEQDPQVSIPKQDVYNDYLLYCERLDIKPLSTADFGKVMKQVFPAVRPRRLGTRGNSRYCYAAMRKTSKLPPPHLPTLGSATTATFIEKDSSNIEAIDNMDKEAGNWTIIKEWAENLLNIRVDNIASLAKHIRNINSNVKPLNIACIPNSEISPDVNITTKKQGQRESNKKRLLVDVGPLKKRRKKKRRGSSSSDSNCNQTVGDLADNASPQEKKNDQNKKLLSNNLLSVNILKKNTSEKIDDGKKLKNVKKEFTNVLFTSSIEQNNQSSIRICAQGEQQITPMNLVSEARNESINIIEIRPKVPIQNPLSESVQKGDSSSVKVKNSTQEIVPMNSGNLVDFDNQIQLASIKEEINARECDTRNIFCKKVLKAQQTKGHWIHTPKVSSSSVAIITTTITTPSPIVTCYNHNELCALNFSMGPPTVLTTIASQINSNLTEDNMNNCQPKVFSRNLQQLRAKRNMIVAATAAAINPSSDSSDLSVVKDADLAENLGLPRERVISICNMDKHELDDYFLPVEEGNSEDQETELLQYFQMGDNDEKSGKYNFSDDTHSAQSTAVAIISTTTTTITVSIPSSIDKQGSTDAITTFRISHSMDEGNLKSDINKGDLLKFDNLSDVRYRDTVMSSIGTVRSSLNVGMVSPTQLSKKHQQVQQLQSQQQHQLRLELESQSSHQDQPDQKFPVKRKLNVDAKTNTWELSTAHKSYSFLPISPNICSRPTLIETSMRPTVVDLADRVTYTPRINMNKNVNLFVSPNESRILSSQQLPQCESNDPMIGCNRRKTHNVSSVSAPPSPSVLRQQRHQNKDQMENIQQLLMTEQWTGNPIQRYRNPALNDNFVIEGTETNSTSTTLFAHHNSLDLDLLAAVPINSTVADISNLSTYDAYEHKMNFTSTFNNQLGNIKNHENFSFNEFTQRSQSVPLFQLQRIHSPLFISLDKEETSIIAHSNSASLTETPLSTDFDDSTRIVSKNTCDQQNTTIKIDDVGEVVASDSTVILDDVDVNDILSSTDLVTKFSSISQHKTIITTCSSAISSSGYSSFSQFNSLLNNSISKCGINNSSINGPILALSRSVPSTPIPYQRHVFGIERENDSSFGQFETNRNLNDLTDNKMTFRRIYNTDKCNSNSILLLSRSASDISKSMPSTPIISTSRSFRYSPSEISRDFLINGNTIDTVITSFSDVNNSNLIETEMVDINIPLNGELLVTNDDLTNTNQTDHMNVDSLTITNQSLPVMNESDTMQIIGSDLLDNL